VYAITPVDRTDGLTGGPQSERISNGSAFLKTVALTRRALLCDDYEDVMSHPLDQSPGWSWRMR
jgi:hypothetical protein